MVSYAGTHEYDSELSTLKDQIDLNISPSKAATVELKNADTMSTVPSFVRSINIGGFITPLEMQSIINQLIRIVDIIIRSA